MQVQTQNIAVRKATVDDFESIFLLLKEFALFQKTPEKLTTTTAQMKQEKDLFQCLVAETEDKEIIGFVSYFPVYFSWSGKAFYVDDLFVTNKYRGNGIGKRLLHYVIDEAKENGCKKVRWQVSDWNTNAIAFYKSLGAVVDDTERNCDLIL